jgi:hypothetical protein
MERFECYGFHKDTNEPKCYTQCILCEREQLLKASGRDLRISDTMMEEIKKHEEAEAKPFKDYRENECFTREDMFLFAGFCIGYRQRNPRASATEMFDVWCATFKSKKDE